MNQLDLCFVAEVEKVQAEVVKKQFDAALDAQRERHIQSWKTCWGWEGPRVGKSAEVGTVAPQKADGSGPLYAYMERVIIEEKIDDHTYIGRIEMNPVVEKARYPKGWPKEGVRLKLDTLDIWVPVREMRTQRKPNVTR